jgi:hypothetical protein
MMCSLIVTSGDAVSAKIFSIKRDDSKKNVVPPGIEPGTFSVLTRCHNQLDHGTEAFDDSSAAAGNYVCAQARVQR